MFYSSFSVSASPSWWMNLLRLSSEMLHETVACFLVSSATEKLWTLALQLLRSGAITTDVPVTLAYLLVIYDGQRNFVLMLCKSSILLCYLNCWSCCCVLFKRFVFLSRRFLQGNFTWILFSVSVDVLRLCWSALYLHFSNTPGNCWSLFSSVFEAFVLMSRKVVLQAFGFIGVRVVRVLIPAPRAKVVVYQ